MDIVNVTDPRNPTLYSRSRIGGVYGIFVSGEYAYVANYGNGKFDILEVRQNRHRQYEPLAVAQSTTIYSGPSESSLFRATLTSSATIPVGSAISYYLSPDDGLHWEEVLPGIEHSFVNYGGQLKWRAELSNTDSLKTPTLTGISISYTSVLDPPLLTSPADGAMTTDNTPTLEWTSVTGATGYLLQIDSSSDFSSPDLMNITVTGATTYSVPSPLLDGTWFWRVATNDTSGDLGRFSSFRNLTIDTTAPTFDEIPSNQTVEYGIWFFYNLNATDPSGIDSWWLNDTVNFHVSTAGEISNLTTLDVGEYGITVFVNDTLGNTRSAEFKVAVVDSTPPAWVEEPLDQVVELGTSFSYNLDATDLSGIDSWWLNDTVNFSISDQGVITNIVHLVVGVYNIEVRAFDPYSNYITGSFRVIVSDTLAPVWTHVLHNHTIELWVEPFRYDLNATDYSELCTWWLNDTLHFVIDSNGVITNATNLPLGNFPLCVWVNDTYGNVLTDEFLVIIRDTIPPYWIVQPVTQYITFPEMFEYYVMAGDFSNDIHWSITPSDLFQIEGQGNTGYIYSTQELSPGIYHLNVTVSDGSGNSISSPFTLLVIPEDTTTTPEDTTTTPEDTTTTTTPEDSDDDILFVVVIAIGGIAGVIVIVIVIYRLKSPIDSAT